MKNCILLLVLTFSLLQSGNTNAGVMPIPDTTVVHQLQDTSTLKVRESQLLVFTKRAAVPLALVGLGVTHMDDEGLFEGSRGLRRVVKRHYPDFATRLDDYTYHAPVAMAVGLNLAGVRGEHHFTEQAILLGMTHLLNRTLTNTLKDVTDIKRPDGSPASDAFPSGHTSTAFAYATFFHKEYGDRSVWYSIAGYSFATATGAMRILNDRHWLSDVLAGAGIGILSAEVVYLVYPYIQQKIALSHAKKQQVGIMPFHSQGASGIALVVKLP